MTKLMLSVVSCLLALGSAARAQDLRPSKELVAAIDEFVEGYSGEDVEPGVAILIHEPGKLLFHKGYGLANLSKRTPITPRTMFELASVSKPFTATAVLLLQDRGKLSIDHDVRTYLPELPVYQRDRPILIRHLLSHTSGLPEYFDFEDVPRHNKAYWNNADYLPMFAKLEADFPQQFKPGDEYEYCNSNYLLLAVIVERVSGKRFDQFLKDEVFGPAGMTHTFVYASPQAVPAVGQADYSRALGYEWSDDKNDWVVAWGAPPERSEPELIVGDGGVWTNLEDMLKWDLAIRSGKFLKPSTWELALTPAATRSGERLGYGLGWTLEYDDPDEINGFGHDGSWGGFRTSYYNSLNKGRSTVLLSNRSDFDDEEFWTGLDEIVERLGN